MATKKKSETTSPLMKQYDEMKKKHPDAILLFRVGDFYETFKEDAVKSSEILGITLTRRNAGKNKSMELTGFPKHALDTYLPKLVRAGCRVAICEQLEDPLEKKKQEKEQKVVELITPQKEEKVEKPKVETSKVESSAQEEKKPIMSKVNVDSLLGAVNTATQQTKEDGKEREVKLSDHVEQKQRPPQMVTINGQKVSHAHVYQGTINATTWYFTAKLDGLQLKPRAVAEADVLGYIKKELSVPDMMQRYYPTKLMPKVTEAQYADNKIDGPQGTLTISKFNVYKERNPAMNDFGKYKFFARVNDKNMSCSASNYDLNLYFDKVATPKDLVIKNFGDRLHLKESYKKFILPENVPNESVEIKRRGDGAWQVCVDLGEQGKPSAKLGYDDGYSYFKTKTATKEQLAAKYLSTQITELMSRSEKESKTAKVKI